MQYFYGPVYSRRLGNSLGVSLFPVKNCTFDCIYCQVGKRRKVKFKRSGSINFFQFKKEFSLILSENKEIDYITISGIGEPTLHKDLGRVIRVIKKVSKNRYPVCVITNASLLYRKKVRRELQYADLVIPSLDAVDSKIFKKINRPHPRIKLKKIIEGLRKLRKEFKNDIWLEIMVIGKINDSMEQAQIFKKIIELVQPDKVQINLPVRPSAEKVLFPSTEKINKIKRIIGKDAEIAVY